MSKEPERTTARAVELLELRDRVDLLDEELRVQKTIFIVTTLVSTVLAVPLLIVLFINAVPFFAAYPSAFIITLGAILAALTVERRRLKEERDAIGRRIDKIEDAPLGRAGG